MTLNSTYNGKRLYSEQNEPMSLNVITIFNQPNCKVQTLARFGELFTCFMNKLIVLHTALDNLSYTFQCLHSHTYGRRESR